MVETLYSAPIGFDTYHNEVRRDTKAIEAILSAEGIPFTPFDKETCEEDYFERKGETEFFDVWGEFEAYYEYLTGILADNGITTYADGYAGMFYVEREEN